MTVVHWCSTPKRWWIIMVHHFLQWFGTERKLKKKWFLVASKPPITKLKGCPCSIYYGGEYQRWWWGISGRVVAMQSWYVRVGGCTMMLIEVVITYGGHILQSWHMYKTIKPTRPVKISHFFGLSHKNEYMYGLLHR